MKFKRIFAAIIGAAVTVGALGGCSSGNGNSSVSESASTESSTGESETETTSNESETSGDESSESEAASSDNTNSSASDKLAQIKQAGVLKISTSPDFAPYEFVDPSQSGQDTYVGSDIECARYIAEKLGVELEITAMSFDACLAAVTQGKVDMSISGYYPSEERKLAVDFTDAYFDDSRQSVVILAENADKFSTVEGFDGATVAAQNGSAQQDIVIEQLPNANMQTISKVTDGVQMVKSGRAEGVMIQGVVADAIVASDSSLAIAAPEFVYDEAELVIAVAKGETELVEALNEILAEINEQELYAQWLVEAQELASTVSE